MKTRIKIAYLDYSHIFAGAERVLHTIIENINKQEFEPILVFPYPMPHHKDYDDLGCKKIYLNDELKWWMGSDRWKRPIRGTDFIMRTIMGVKLVNFLRKENVDILHVNLLRRDSLMWLLPSHLYGIKIIGHFRSHKADWVATKYTQKCCNLILCVSEFSKSIMSSKGIYTNVAVLYDSIEVRKFNCGLSKIEAKEKLGFDRNCHLISSVGQLSIRKGHDNAIRSFAKILNDYPKSILFIAGGGSNDELQKLKNLAKQLNVESSVSFSEKQISNINEVYRASDLVLSLTKDGEAFGLVPYEAALLGTPFIAPQNGAIKEFVINKENGVLADSNDIDDIYRNIIWCLENESKLQKLLQKTKEVIKAKLLPNIMIMNIEEKYRFLLKNR